jgi:hypothetical protein
MRRRFVAREMPTEADRTPDRDRIERAIEASFLCPNCGLGLAVYREALLGLSAENASWSETIGTVAFLAPELVNARTPHTSGLPLYVPSKRRSSVGRRSERGLRIRLPAIVLCSCGRESRLTQRGRSDLAQAWDEERRDLSRQALAEMEHAEQRAEWDAQQRAWRDSISAMADRSRARHG